MPRFLIGCAVVLLVCLQTAAQEKRECGVRSAECGPEEASRSASEVAGSDLVSDPNFKDYFESLGNLRGWNDGGRFFTNYVAHPLQGAVTGFIQIQNDPDGARREFGGGRGYWRSRLKALGWSAINSTQFELGPVSQASLGTGVLVGEDLLDRHVVRRLERGSDSLFLRVAARMLLNPARSCANLLRFKKPWHRDTR